MIDVGSDLLIARQVVMYNTDVAAGYKLGENVFLTDAYLKIVDATENTDTDSFSTFNGCFPRSWADLYDEAKAYLHRFAIKKTHISSVAATTEETHSNPVTTTTKDATDLPNRLESNRNRHQAAEEEQLVASNSAGTM